MGTAKKQTKSLATKDILQDVVLIIAQLDIEERNPRKLYLKAKAVEAVTSWLRAERNIEVMYTRLAPI